MLATTGIMWGTNDDKKLLLYDYKYSGDVRL